MSDTEQQCILYDSTYIKCKQICNDKITDQLLPGVGGKGRNGMQRGTRNILQVMSFCEDGFMTVYNCQNSLSCVPKDVFIVHKIF